MKPSMYRRTPKYGKLYGLLDAYAPGESGVMVVMNISFFIPATAPELPQGIPQS